MNITSAIGLGLVAAVLSIILRQYKPEFSLYISLAAGAVILGAVISALIPAKESIERLAAASGISGTYAAALMKALAICYMTQLTTDACRDAGEAAIAGKLEIAGRIAITLISLPLFESIASVVTGLIGG